MSSPLPLRFDHEFTVVSVTDGDTVRGHLTRVVGATDDFTLTLTSHDPRGVPIRLLWVDTPERTDTDGWRRARNDTTAWLAAHAGALRCETHGRDNLNRTLGDVYHLDVDGARHSVSEWLIRERGWPVYEDRA